MNEHTASWDNHGTRERWQVPSLWKAAEGMQVLTLFLGGFEEVRNPDGWIYYLPDLSHPLVRPEIERLWMANLSYPILLHPSWWVMDGYHRMGRAILNGQKTIQAVRFLPENLPPPETQIV